MISMKLYFLIMAPIFLGLLMYVRPLKKLSRVTILVQSVMLWVSVANFFSIKRSGLPIISGLGDDGVLGINLYSDLTSAVFVILITALFLIFSIYIYDSLLENGMFLFLFFSVESMIILTFLSLDLFNIFIAIEISTILAALLITFKREKRSMYDGMIFLMSNTVGSLFFLFGVAMLYKTFGVLDIFEIKKLMANVSPRAVAIPYSLIITGVAVKCAFMPVFSWLPKAHGTPGAPPIVSALLSGVYIKSGIYIYIKMRDMFLPAIDMDEFFIVIGLMTSLLGVIFALMQVDMKLILAYSTISQMGLILIAVSISEDYTRAGGLLHIMNHAMFKSLLFMASGMIAYQYKTRNIEEIRGVFRKLPITGLSMIIGILGVTGAPLLNGSLSKYFIQSGLKGEWIESFIVFINFGTMLYFVKFGTILLPKPICNTTEPESPYRTLALSLLSIACLVTGLSASFISSYFLDISVSVDFHTYLEKIALWIVLIVLSLIFYTFFVHKKIFFKESPRIDLSFNNISLSIVILFFVILSFTYIKI